MLLHAFAQFVHASLNLALYGMDAGAGYDCDLFEWQVEIPVQNEGEAFFLVKRSQRIAKLNTVRRKPDCMRSRVAPQSAMA